MIVQIFRETRPTAATNILQDNIDQIDNDNTLRSMFSGDSFPTNPAPLVGQPCYRTDLKKLFIYTADGWVEIMGKPIYDPRSISADVFHMDNMTEGANTKIMTSAERDKLNNAVTGPASSIDGEIALFNGTSGKALKNSGLTPGGYNFLPIGMPIPIWDHLSVVKPPNSGGGAIYIKLTAGQSGPGGYNQGLLRNETVSGSAPLVTATAVINLSDSPIYNQTVHLINTEEAFIRARTVSGELQNDQMQRITGYFQARDTGVGGAFRLVSTERVWRWGDERIGNIVFDSANSPNARASSTTSGETRSKNVSATWYLRIR